VELHDPAATPTALLDVLLDLGCPHDFLVSDDGLDRRLHDTDSAHRRSWTSSVDTAHGFLAETPQAAAYARRILPPRATHKIAAIGADRGVPPPIRRKGRPRLGIVTPRLSVAEAGFVRELSRAVGERSADVDLVVLGETPTDEGLLRLGNVFVSGRIAPAELPRVLRAYGISHVFTGFARPLFGHPLVEGALNDARPVAALDWAQDEALARTGDLPLAPSGRPAAIARDVLRWLIEASI